MTGSREGLATRPQGEVFEYTMEIDGNPEPSLVEVFKDPGTELSLQGLIEELAMNPMTQDLGAVNVKVFDEKTGKTGMHAFDAHRFASDARPGEVMDTRTIPYSTPDFRATMDRIIIGQPWDSPMGKLPGVVVGVAVPSYRALREPTRQAHTGFVSPSKAALDVLDRLSPR